MFHKILIANRGEIACRVAATARRLGLRTVAVYSDADAHSAHVAACDQAVCVGAAAPRDSYLRADRILQAARESGAQAIHPGYGFLSENADFAQACLDAGLVFIGPPPAAIRAMGLKAASKALMAQAGVPLVPGYHGADQDPAHLQVQADAIGYPVLIKASAGGGGKGMRVVERSADFLDALTSCKREAASSFANDAVLIEKYVQRPRHIEFQIFADQHGACIHLGERDCSVQRRHQKVLEEAPAPGMTAALRARMGAAAVAAARAVGYVGAGTVEFIVEQDDAGGMDFFFMEMNTRLQVEHPVTEAITGLDLVEWQLRVATGEPLPLSQDQVHLSGHAIEARLCAEAPERDFLPATGRLAVYAKPAHSAFAVSALRFDDGMRAGDAITPWYDPMLAKLIVHGATRQQALARLDAALAATHLVGVANNVDFLRRVIASPSFAQAQLDTGLIARESARLFGPSPLTPGWVVAATLAHSLAELSASAPAGDPFGARDGWHSHLPTQQVWALRWETQAIEATLLRGHDGALHLRWGEHNGALAWHQQADGALVVEWDGQRERLWAYSAGPQVHLFFNAGHACVERIDRLAHAGDTHPEGGRLSAPMPGKLIAYAVAVGDSVTRGQTLAVMEAMKMEHTLSAPTDGVVTELLYAPGDQLADGVELLRLQTDAAN